VLPQPIYVVTGGQGRYGRHEAEVMADLLLERGVSPDHIVLERTGRNTLRSAVAVARILRGAKGPVYAATSAYHMPRAVLLLGITGLDAHRSPPSIGPASSKVLRRWWWRLREIPAVPIDGAILLWMRMRDRIHPSEPTPPSEGPESGEAAPPQG
jgi:uncharacterized SAM-binding protein YcdF (DUF218 family)